MPVKLQLFADSPYPFQSTVHQTMNEQNELFNWYKKTNGTQRYTTLTCVQAGHENKQNYM